MKKLLALFLFITLLFTFGYAEEVVSSDYTTPVEVREEEVQRSVSVYSNSFDEGYIYVGETVVLKFRTEGFLETDSYSITWQESQDGGNTWTDVGTDETYSFTINMTNKNYSWRVILTLE